MKRKKLRRVIRQSLFETNSSSSHSFTVAKSKSYAIDPIIPDENGEITFVGDEFGWGYERYTDSYTKANYLATHFIVKLNYAHSDYDLLKDPLWNKFSTVISTVTKCSKVKIGDYDTDYAYIDHQSDYVPVEILELELDDIKNWIFNTESILIIDNDNH